jgi:transcriptional regulator with XRE-family HTH domain
MGWVAAVADEDQSALGVFAGELRHARTRHGLSQEQLAEKIAYSGSLVGMVEAGRRMPSLDFAQRCDDALDTGGVLARLHPLVAGEAFPSWFRPFVELERSATSLRAWEPVLIPGLLQTDEYARAILRASRPRDTDVAIDQLVTARLARQEILTRDDPPDLWVIIDEATLRRPVGEPVVMAAQLDKLLAAGRTPWVTVQVMPTAAGAHPGLLGPFLIAGFAAAPDIAYLDSALSGQVIERPEDVRQVTALFDTMRAEALPPRASAALITEAVDTWT